MFKTLLFAPAFAAAVLVPLSAETKANFSGAWKLKEDAGKTQGPRNIVFKIDHKEPAFKYSASGETAQGEPFTEAAEFAIDGKEYPGIHSGKVSARWESETLVVVYDIGGNRITMTLKLSADGKQMFRDIFGMHEIYDKR